jgi:hypothetical protein
LNYDLDILTVLIKLKLQLHKQGRQCGYECKFDIKKLKGTPATSLVHFYPGRNCEQFPLLSFRFALEVCFVFVWFVTLAIVTMSGKADLLPFDHDFLTSGDKQ